MNKETRNELSHLLDLEIFASQGNDEGPATLVAATVPFGDNYFRGDYKVNPYSGYVQTRKIA
jgi:hypothetical protein